MKPASPVALRDRVRMWAGLLLLGLLCALWAGPAWLLRRVMPRPHACHMGRTAVTGFFRIYLRALVWIGAARLDLSELDALRGAGPQIIAPNHPSLLDAVLIISRVPQLGCVLKDELLRNIFLSAGARLAGYISNASLRDMIRRSVEELQHGQSLLLFPEGTRSSAVPIGPIQRAVCVIARAARVPVQTVIIEAESPYLSKGWTLFHCPSFPIVYRIRPGRIFEVGDDDTAFLNELQQYFSDELSKSAGPAAAAGAGAAGYAGPVAGAPAAVPAPRSPRGERAPAGARAGATVSTPFRASGCVHPVAHPIVRTRRSPGDDGPAHLL